MRKLFARAAALAAVCAASTAMAQNWPAVFDPLQVLSLNLEMDPADWQTIQDDETFEIEVPATFWADGETPILVSVRSKSSEPLQNGTPFKKVSLKIDFDEFVDGQAWHRLKKLSLENGSDQDVVSEGLAWHLNRLASGPEGYGYEHPAALAAWVRLAINGVQTGVYISVEQRDKRFLQNRGLFVDGETWFYDVKDIDQWELEVGDPHSPTYLALCYSPFRGVRDACPTPDAATLAAQLPTLVNMRGILTLAAVDAIIANPDGIFSHAKNFLFIDFLSGRTRMYVPWDLDSVMGGHNYPLYSTPTPYAAVLLGVPEFRALYSRIVNDLLCGPMREENLRAFVSSIKPILSGPLSEDPNSQIDGGDMAAFFEGRRAWLSERLMEIAAQVEGYVPCPPPCAADFNGDGELSSQDFFDFVGAFFAGSADFNRNGRTDSQDFFDFLAAFFMGC